MGIGVALDMGAGGFLGSNYIRKGMLDKEIILSEGATHHQEYGLL